MGNQFDYSKFEDDQAPSGNALARLTELADQYQEETISVLKAEEELKKAKERLRVLEEVTIPAAMEEAKTSKIVTKSGLMVEVKGKMFGNISAANKEKAHKWLEEHGHERLIKQQFVVLFGREDEDWAAKFARDCAQRKRPLHLKREKTVHPQTLRAWVREQKGNGVPIPDDLFGVFEKQVASVKLAMKPKD